VAADGVIRETPDQADQMKIPSEAKFQLGLKTDEELLAWLEAEGLQHVLLYRRLKSGWFERDLPERLR
jgi:hypothetical protein